MFDKTDMLIVRFAGEEATLGAIAKRVNLTNSAVTARLKKLEEKVGRKLINRRQYGFGITADGVLFLESAERIFREIEVLQRNFEKSYSQQLIVFSEPLVNTIPHKIIKQFSLAHPNLKVHFHTRNSDECFALLRDKTADVVLVHETRDLINVEFDLLFQERLAVVFNADSVLATATGNLFLESLLKLPQVLWLGASKRIVSRVNRDYPFGNAAASADDLQAAIELASLGLGWLIVTERIAKKHQVQSLLYRVLADRWAYLDVYVGWRSNDQRHDLHDFLDLIRDAYT